MDKKHIVSFSGGKDSTAMLLRMIELNYKIDDIIFCDTGLEFDELIEYVIKIESYINKKITIIKPEKDWDYWFYKKITKGDKTGQIYGFPYIVGAWCNNRLKIRPMNKYFKKIGKNHIRYIGIASDEPQRLLRLKENCRTPLVEWGWSEDDCLKYLKSKNLLNPLYNKFKRIGCYLCPKQSIGSLRILFNDYPEKWSKLKQYEKDSPIKFKPDRNLEYFETIFSEEKMQGRLF